MAKPTGFMEYERREVPYRPVSERVRDYFEMELPLPEETLLEQAARCMDCGIPFCHGVGCPLANRIPEFNDLVYRGRWREACENLHATNNFPEITARICPAPCETACTLGINDKPVLIRHIEYQVVERGFSQGWIKPQPPEKKTGKRVAIVGSGPAGLAAAQQLARAGHDAVVFEKDDESGGILRYGIPDFKLDKMILERRLAQLRAEGVQFQTNVLVGQDVSARYLQDRFDAVCLTMGTHRPRDLKVEGRELANVVFALDYLRQQNRVCAGAKIEPEKLIRAQDKIVVIIGGGDTGSDCVGTAQRQGAKEIHQLEILPKPPEQRSVDNPWPQWPQILRTSSSQEEGCRRRWCVRTRKLSGQNGRVTQLHGVQVDWNQGPSGWEMTEIGGTEFTMPVELVVLAMGFEHVIHEGLIEQLDVELDQRGNVVVDANNMTNVEGIFAAGDAVRGASLVVWAISSGREAAAGIDKWLQNKAKR